jgi:hypothetical protein
MARPTAITPRAQATGQRKLNMKPTLTQERNSAIPIL